MHWCLPDCSLRAQPREAAGSSSNSSECNRSGIPCFRMQRGLYLSASFCKGIQVSLSPADFPMWKRPEARQRSVPEEVQPPSSFSFSIPRPLEIDKKTIRNGRDHCPGSGKGHVWSIIDYCVPNSERERETERGREEKEKKVNTSFDYLSLVWFLKTHQYKYSITQIL